MSDAPEVVERTATDDEEEGDNPFGRLGRRLGLSAHRTEWLVGILLAVVAVALTAYMARDLWFTTDEWEFLANRTAFDLGDLTRPSAGHWTTWSTLLLRAIYQAVGVDFWPWFYVPRLIGHTLLVTLIWRVTRWRGADPLVAMAGYAVLLVLGASGYQRALQLGNWTVYAVLILCAWIINRRPDEPTTRDRVVVAIALVVAVLGNGYAVAAIAGITAGLLLTRRLVRWIPSLVPALVAYGIWYLNYRGDLRPKPQLTVSAILGIPAGAFRVSRAAVESATAFPGWLAAVVVLGVVTWILWLILRRKLDLFDAIILWTLAAGLSLLTIQRVSLDSDAANRLRYGYSVLVLLALALVPHIRLPRTTLARVGVAVVTLALLAANVSQMRDAINVREDEGQRALVLSVAAAGMIDAGEPVVPVPSPLVPGLESDELVQLVGEGYHPAPLPENRADLEQIEAEARGVLRISVLDANRQVLDDYDLVGVPPTTDAAVDADGCITLSEGEPVAASVTGPAQLTLTKGPGQVLALTWEDEFGEGTRRVDDPDLRRTVLTLAAPNDTAELTLESRVGDMTVCGFAN